MAIVSTGYDGSVDETVWASNAATLGAEAGVRGVTDCAVTVSGGGVNVAAGTAYGDGVADTITTDTALTFDAPTIGHRYDAVVLRRDWTANSTALAVVPGTPTRTVPPLQDQPGTVVEHPLALIQLTSGAAPVLADDLRVTYAPTGVAQSVTGMTGPVGSRYVLAGTGRRYMRSPSGAVPEWEPAAPAVPPVPVVRSGSATVTFNATGAAQIVHGLGFTPSIVIARSRSTSTSNLVRVTVSTAPGAVNGTYITVVAKVADAAAGWKPYVGSLSYVDWVAHSWTTPPVDAPDEPDPDNVTPPVTSGGGGDTVGRDTDAAPAPQIPIPDTPPIYVVTTPTASSVASILSTAAAELGVRESPSGSNNVKYWLSEKPTWNGQPWCAAFTSWVYRRNGIVVTTALGISNPYYTPTLESGAKAKGLWYTGTPRPGDMVIYGGSANTHAVHVELVEKWVASTGRVQTIGGNTSDGMNGSPNNGGGVYRNSRNPRSASLPVRGYIRMPTSVPTNLKVRGPFPLPTGHYFGVADAGTTMEHNGVADNAQGVMQIQAEVGATVDGVYGAATETQVRKWQASYFRTQTGRIAVGDWQVLAGTIVAPPPPTGVVGTAGNSSVTVVFNASSGAQQYTAVASTGQTATGTASPLTITGLTPGIPVTASVTATNVGGASNASARTATLYPVEGGLSTVALTDGSVIPVWAGSSRFSGALVGTVVTNIGSQAVYNAFTSRFPAARFTPGAQQMARNICAVLYGATYPAPPNRPSIRFAFSGGDFLAQSDPTTGIVTYGQKSVGASVTASYATHELVHLFQAFASTYGTDPYVTGVIEGIADYVLVVIGYHTKAAQRPTGGGANWWDGYDTTAFFFDYIVSRAPNPTPDFVQKLNQQMKNASSWTPSQITSINAAGKTVGQLWSDYKTWVLTH